MNASFEEKEKQIKDSCARGFELLKSLPDSVRDSVVIEGISDCLLEIAGAGIFKNESVDANTSGLHPVEYKILIAPEEVERTTSSGIILADKLTEREKMAQVRGKLIAVGGNAFEDWQEPIPKVGDVVSYAKYAGLIVKGSDEKEYRLANDKDITAIVQ